jgi:hypothetical protein
LAGARNSLLREVAEYSNVSRCHELLEYGSIASHAPIMSHPRDWRRARPEPHWPLAGLGHNGGPPLDDDEPPGKLLLVRHHWRRAYKAARTVASMDIIKFRARRAEAAGISYEDYENALLDTGRYLQRADIEARKGADACHRMDIASRRKG